MHMAHGLRAIALLVAARRTCALAGPSVGCRLTACSGHARAVVHSNARREAEDAVNPGMSPHPTFYDPTCLGFADLGLDPEVVACARRAGYNRPSRVQQMAIPALLNGGTRDTQSAHAVVTAETGSGKTLAYLLPVLHDLLHAGEGGSRALVLVPNPALCDQIVGLVELLAREDGSPLVRAEVASLAEPPVWLPGTRDAELPAVVVATPTGILDHLQVHYEAAAKRRWFARHLRHLVLDEADTLLSAGFDAALRRLAVLLLYGRHDHPLLRKIHNAEARERHMYKLLGMLARGTYLGAPRLIFAAATMPAGNSPRSVGSMLARSLPSARWVRSAGTHRRVAHVRFDWEELELSPPRGLGPDTVSDAAAQAAEAEGSDEGVDGAAHDEMLASLIPAELPPAVSAALRAHGHETACALVFCNKIAHADALAAALRLEGLPARAYHRAVPRQAREEALEAMRPCPAPTSGAVPRQAREEALQAMRPCPAPTSGAFDSSVHVPGTVLVCTDAAARGLDLPAVGHVIHADFAQNAVSFLHRSGRTGRAGRAGRVTCFYTRGDRELVHQLRAAISEDAPLEPVFSRKRSFRKRIRREGDVQAAGGQR